MKYNTNGGEGLISTDNVIPSDYKYDSPLEAILRKSEVLVSKVEELKCVLLEAIEKGVINNA